MKVLRKMKNTVVADPPFALFPLYFYKFTIIFVSKQLHRKALKAEMPLTKSKV